MNIVKNHWTVCFKWVNVRYVNYISMKLSFFFEWAISMPYLLCKERLYMIFVGKRTHSILSGSLLFLFSDPIAIRLKEIFRPCPTVHVCLSFFYWKCFLCLWKQWSGIIAPLPAVFEIFNYWTVCPECAQMDRPWLFRAEIMWPLCWVPGFQRSLVMLEHVHA